MSGFQAELCGRMAGQAEATAEGISPGLHFNWITTEGLA
jgi:hypothetical protein